MSDYSGYQRKRTHAQGPFTSVYEATAPNGGPGRFALKIFHPPASSGIRRAYAIEGWLLAAERQQKAAKKDGAVLEVVAFGRCPEGAYLVTPWREHSLEPLVDTLAARGDLLRAVAEMLLNALEQWGAQTGGSHRKLKPSNVFLTRSGPLAGMTAVLSDPWFLLGVKSETPRRSDLAAVGAILAQIVRRREVAAWPIEDAPEWKALGRPGKAWLAYVNYLMDPQPAAGELTIAEARKRLRAIPKDANPARTALFAGAGMMGLAAAAVLAFARFGDPIYMPNQIKDLANKIGNPRAQITEVPRQWANLCIAWDTWLVDLQGNGRRMLRVEALWEPNDPLRRELENFLATANNLRPEVLVPAAAGEKRLGLLANSPPKAVLAELLTPSVNQRVEEAGARLVRLQSALVNWGRWEQLRALQRILEERNFTRAAAALGPKLPQAAGTAGYRLDMPRTLKLFNDLSLDETGALLLATRWGEVTKVKLDMEGTTDRVQKEMPRIILARLSDRSSLGAFADALEEPLTELKARRARYLDPQVVKERFLADAPLQKETGEVTAADFPRWEEQLFLFSKVAASDDPRLVASLDASDRRLAPQGQDLEQDAPEPEPNGVPTLSQAGFEQELAARRAELVALRAREIVRDDLPEIAEATNQLAARFQLLEQRVEATLVLLRPETWLAKVRQAYGRFNETRQRWAAWQATIAGVTADSLRGLPNRPRFRELRQQERQVKEFINGLEGPEGLGALAVPDLGAFSPETAEALRQLEATRREQAATQAAAAVDWRNGLPVTAWASATTTMREPIEAHRQWLADLPAFATDLDRLGTLLAGGFSWAEGVSEVMDRLGPRPGLDALAGKPVESVAEARLLGQLVTSTDRAALVAAAQSGGLSRMLTAWRRLGTLAGWPANADDLDIDGGVVESLRKIVPEAVRDELRRARLLDELGRETRVRWNRAARNSAADENQMAAVFERMEKYHIAESDLADEALANLHVWRLKRSDWSEVELPPLRARRDEFVAKMRAIPGAMARPEVKKFVDELDTIELVVDRNRPPTPSPRMAGWKEEMTDAGLGLTATWQRGGKTVKLDFAVVQPPDGTPPFYLARRVLAVGEFLDLFATRPREEVDAVMAKMPVWAVGQSYNKPYNRPMAWRPFIANNGKYEGFELNPSWFFDTTAAVKGLMEDEEVQGKVPSLAQAVSERPTLRSPLQQVPPDMAKLFVERMLGARLPTTREWQAVLQVVGTPAPGNFRGSNFQELFNYLRDYNVAGQTIPWRPNEGAFLPRVTVDGQRRNYSDDGQASADRDASRFWFTTVDEGPATAGFINLSGNISIFLQEGANQFFVAGGSALSPPGIDFTQPQKVEAAALIGSKPGNEPYSDVGIRPAFDAPPGFKERFRLLELVRKQGFLTW